MHYRASGSAKCDAARSFPSSDSAVDGMPSRLFLDVSAASMGCETADVAILAFSSGRFIRNSRLERLGASRSPMRVWKTATGRLPEMTQTKADFPNNLAADSQARAPD